MDNIFSTHLLQPILIWSSMNIYEYFHNNDIINLHIFVCEKLQGQTNRKTWKIIFYSETFSCFDNDN